MSAAPIDYNALASQARQPIDYSAMADQARTTADAPTEPDLTANPNGEGLYAMWNDKGQKLGIPYSQVQTATEKGYKFDTNPVSSGLTPAQQFVKDQAADPARTGGTSLRLTPNPAQIDNADPGTAGNLVAGVAKGAGTLATPVLDLGNLIAKHTGGNPVDINAMLAAHGAAQTTGKVGTIAATILPSLLANPVGTLSALGGGAVGGTAGHFVGKSTGMSPEATALLSDATGLAGGVGGAKLGSIPALQIPSASRAGAVFQSLNKDLANTPVNLNAAAGPLQRATEIGVRGSALPKSVSDLLTRSQSAVPMTFPEARDYQSSLSDLSTSDKLAMNGRMRGAVAQLNKALYSDVKDAADTQGRGGDFAAAMKEYRQQAQIKQVLSKLGKTAVGAVGAGTLYELLKAAKK